MRTDIKGKRGKKFTDPHGKKTERKEMSGKTIKLSKCKCICCRETNGCVAKCQHFSQATLFSLFFLFFRLWFDFWTCSTQTFCTLSSPSQATHYLTLPPDRITSTTKATLLPTTSKVNIVATNIKHGG